MKSVLDVTQGSEVREYLLFIGGEWIASEAGVLREH